MTTLQDSLIVEKVGTDVLTDAYAEELLAMYAAVQAAVAGSDNDPMWEIGVHPSAEQLREAAAEGTLFVARIGQDSEGTVDARNAAGVAGAGESGTPGSHAASGGPIVGAMVANRHGAPGYDSFNWTVDAAPGEAAVMHLFGINPDYRGQGLARPFVSAVEDALRADGVRAFRLDTLAGNLGAQRTYEALGFTNLGFAQLDYGEESPYDDVPENGFVLFEKAL